MLFRPGKLEADRFQGARNVHWQSPCIEILAQGADILFDLNQSSLVTPKRRVSHCFRSNFARISATRTAQIRFFDPAPCAEPMRRMSSMPMTRPDLPMDVVLQVDMDQRRRTKRGAS
jgi:hypothetical protein